MAHLGERVVDGQSGRDRLDVGGLKWHVHAGVSHRAQHSCCSAEVDETFRTIILCSCPFFPFFEHQDDNGSTTVVLFASTLGEKYLP